MSSKRKLTTLTYADKLKVIEAVKNGLKRKDVAVQYGISESTLSLIVKKEAELLKKQKSGESLLGKRQKHAVFPILEQCLFAWYKQCRNINISVSGPILKEKAEEFAKSMEIRNFKASNGWLENFKKRHGLAFKKMEWKSELLNLLNDYDPNDVFNADETGLLFKCLPDETLTLKDKKCHGGEHSKERLTILLCVNSTGTEKLKPLIIGKSKKPCCESLPMEYEANNKAWITAQMFKNWLINIDNQMANSSRKVLLFIDNCTAHVDIPPLKAVTVQFLPTTQLQPLEQGIIKNFKTFYRKEVLKKLITDIEQNTVSPIDVVQATRMVDKAWQNVTTLAVKNCFRTCGFSSECPEILEEEENEVPEEWNIHMFGSKVTFEEFVTCDDEVITAGTLTEEEILEPVCKVIEGHNDEPLFPSKSVSTNEARSAIITLRSFIEQCTNIKDEVFSSLSIIENLIDKETKDNHSLLSLRLNLK